MFATSDPFGNNSGDGRGGGGGDDPFAIAGYPSAAPTYQEQADAVDLMVKSKPTK
jgi:hypothetical protein